MRISKLGSNFVSEEKYQLLTQILQRKFSGAKCVPLSFGQEQLWFLSQLQPKSPAYNLFTAYRLRGPLDITLLERCLNELVARHETLRTAFIAFDGNPVQVVCPTLTLTLPMGDLRSLPGPQREITALQLATEAAQRPFDLTQSPLMRISLLRMDEEEYCLLLTMHHIISDEWSVRVFFRELATLYSAFLEGKPSPLAELPVQYGDFAHWQRQWLQGEVLESLLSYWKHQLAGAPVLLALPASHPRPPLQSYQGAWQSILLPSTLVENLQALCQQEQVTLFMVLLAAFQTLLYRYTGQNDIVVGSAVAGRNQVKVEELLGFFANTLVMRTNLSGNPPFRELLRRVRTVALDAYVHQDLPFGTLVEALQPKRHPSYNPLFQVEFTFQNSQPETLEVPGLVLSRLEVDPGTAKFDLTLAVEKTEQGLSTGFGYTTALFEAATITRMLGHFHTLLESIVANPDLHIGDLALLTAAERRQLLTVWHETQTVSHEYSCFYQLFEAQVESTPEAVAATYAEQHMTYRELNQQAQGLALHLIEQAVAGEVIVALFAERSIDFLIAMIAIFKAGGAYLPLDPHYPLQRSAQILDASKVSLVLAGRAFISVVSQIMLNIPLEKRPQVLCIEDLLLQKSGKKDLPGHHMPRKLAYVMYTSGSTGVPKGAMIEHGGMLNHLCAKVSDLGLTNADTVAQTASQCFDISVWQFLAVLLVGGKVSIFTDELSHDPWQLIEQVDEKSISILEIVPSFTQTLVEQVANSASRGLPLQALRWLLLTGEALPPELCRQWFHYFPAIPLMNAYGPTECSDDITHYALFTTLPIGASHVPVGRPIQNTHIYILDPQLQPLPIGIAGEVYVSGAGVGRGYLNDARRTALAFIPNPFDQGYGTRLYKTGDLARYRPDGTIELLGRVDHQIKLRGFRIELGEIEAILNQHPDVREAVVITRKDTRGDTYLAAYVVPDQTQDLTISSLYRHLKEKLPSYMVPSFFIILDSFPLTSNGKIDRRALPAPTRNESETGDAFVAPRTPVEEVLATIWAEALDLKQVSIQANFFDLGGYSLLATRIISRVRKVFHIKLPLRSFFEYPTVVQLSQVLIEHEESAGQAEKIARMFRRIEGMSEQAIREMVQDIRKD